MTVFLAGPKYPVPLFVPHLPPAYKRTSGDYGAEFYVGQMLILPPIYQCQSSDGKTANPNEWLSLILFSTSPTINIIEHNHSRNRPVAYPMCQSVCLPGKCIVAK